MSWEQLPQVTEKTIWNYIQCIVKYLDVLAIILICPFSTTMKFPPPIHWCLEFVLRSGTHIYFGHSLLVVIPLCDTLESILCFFVIWKKDLGQTKPIVPNLSIFIFNKFLLISYIYCLCHQSSIKNNLWMLQLFIVILRYKFPKS